MKRFFNGGVHPRDWKELSAGTPLVRLPGPPEVVIPLWQHIGAPCQSLVKPGDFVKLGQKIGDGTGLCVPVHASVSGRVLAVEPRPHPGGGKELAVVIENDGQDTPCQPLISPSKARNLPPEEFFSLLREAGIVGMGGAAFPTGAKARSAFGKVDTLIANACECEPYITADDTLLRTCPERVLEGMKLMRRALAPKRVILGIEDNKKEAAQALGAVMEKRPELAVEVNILPTRYPQGAEKQLIQAVTGRRVPPGELPAAVGCAVFNVATFAAVYDAAVQGQPLTRRIVTVTGESVNVPVNVIAPIGTPYTRLIEAAGGLREDVWKVLCGGPMMGLAQADLQTPVLKSTNAVVCLSKERKDERENPVCIRCGKCLGVCPVNLQPLYLYRYEQSKNLEQLKRLNVVDCIECGCCSYICPGKLPLKEYIREGKRAVREEGKK